MKSGADEIRCNESQGRALTEVMLECTEYCRARTAQIQSLSVRWICLILMLVTAIVPSRTSLLASPVVEHNVREPGETGCQHCNCGGDNSCCLKARKAESKSPAQAPVRTSASDSIAILLDTLSLEDTARDLTRIGRLAFVAEIVRATVPTYIRNCSLIM
jgi:hypothetical protein